MADVEGLVQAVVEKFGKIDILINNAGIARDKLILRMTEEDWDAVLGVNLKGTFNCTKAVIKHMSKQRSGKVVSIASVVGEMGNAGQANYSASKAGVIGFTKTVAREFAQRGINVNAIAPGYIQTPMTDALPEKAKEELKRMIPMERLGQPEDVARAVLFLVSEASSYITGHVLNVNGGYLYVMGGVKLPPIGGEREAFQRSEDGRFRKQRSNVKKQQYDDTAPQEVIACPLR